MPKTSAIPTRLFDGDTFEYRGYTFRFKSDYDPDMGAPWEEHDGHGIVSKWTTRDKQPGERVICSDRHSKRYYDVQATMQLAKHDGWGCSKHHHTAKGEECACAVEQDYEYLAGWCEDRWHWIYVMVELVDDYLDERESLGGLTDREDDQDYVAEVVKDMCEAIISRIEVDPPNAQLSEN